MVCALAWAVALPALAQTPPEPETAEHTDADACAAEDKTDETAKAEGKGEPADEDEDCAVIVNGKRALNRIDRQVYDVGEDPDNATGTTGDALEKIPGVNVTPSGDVTLHGNSVEILVNGKPSPLFAGDNRAAALRAMPSGTISSIEVMSNPGAQYGSSSAGGIINIVTKQRSPPGMLASVNGQIASTGSYGAGGFIQYNAGRFATTASLNVSEFHSWTRSRSSQAELDANGQPTRSTDNNGVSDSVSRTTFGSASVDYDAGAFDTVTGQFDFMKMSSTSHNVGTTTIRNASGEVTDQFDSEGHSDFSSDAATVGLGWMHIGKTLGETLKIDGKITRTTSQSDGDVLMDYALSSIPGNLGMRRQPNVTDNDATRSVLSADYNGYLGDDQVSAGLQIDREDASQGTVMFSLYQPGIGTLAANPLLTNRFDYRQTINAAYVTYQKALGDRWVVLGGIRAELLDYDSVDALSAPVEVAYTNINPSFFATYVISDLRKIRLNYARRLQRPSTYELNTSLVYINAQTVRVGAPALKPQEINAFEASYEYAKLMTSYSVRAYRIDNDRMINPVTEIIPDPQGAGNQVILLSRRNAGWSRQTGVQLTYSNSFSERWSVNANVDVYGLDMQLPDVPGLRSLVTVSSQVGINYMHGKNAVSLNYFGVGKQLTGDGYTNGFGGGSLSWYRNLTPKLDLTISINDIFKPREVLFVRETGSVRSISASTQRAPTFEIRLNRRFASGSFALSE